MSFESRLAIKPASLPDVSVQSAAVTKDGEHTYGQILRSSALIGGSSILVLAIGIARTKAMALMLGPSGFGLFSLYGSIADVAISLAGMGVRNGGVRQIAESVGSDDTAQIARTVTVLRRISTLLAMSGGVLLVVFSPLVSTLTFGNDQHVGAVALLSLAVLFSVIAGAQQALIQGMRRISDLARMGVLGALLGTSITIPTVYLLHEDGVAPSLVAVAALSLLTSWWYSRKVRIESSPMTVVQIRQEAASLIHLGLAFMASGFLMMGAAYAVRIIVLRNAGLEAAAFYQAAWTLGGLYVGFVLQAMGTDFYPRLVGAAKDNPLCTRLVNEQAQVSLLLAGPGVLATLTFAPLVTTLFYSAEFDAAVGLLRWICLGMTLRVITWPMGFIIVAQGRQAIFFATELAWTLVSVGLAWLSVGAFGLNGAGIAFFGSYVFHAFMIYPIVRVLSGFRWSPVNRKTAFLFLLSIAFVFGSFHVLPPLLATSLGVTATVLSGMHSIRTLLTLVAPARIPSSAWRLLELFRRARTGLK